MVAYEQFTVCWKMAQARALHDPVGEGTGDSGGATADAQLLVDVLQVGAHGSLRYTQVAGDLGVGAPGGHQAQQVGSKSSNALSSSPP
jgi:hypothetical protein